MQGRTITSNVEEKIHKQAYRRMASEYWERKKRISEGAFEKIQWKRYKGAIQQLPLGRRQWVHKHHCGFEGNNYMLYKWRQRTTPHCPNCAEVETHRHILRCQSRQATAEYQKLEGSFAQWLYRTTSPEMKELVLMHLQAYRNTEEVEEEENWNEEIRRVWEAQRLAGPNAFAEGCLVKEWEQQQAKYLESINSKRTPGRWVKELIKKMWNICWDLWESRNAEVHQTTATRKEVLLAQLDREIQETKSLGILNDFLPRAEKQFFKQPIREVLKQTEYERRLWLHVAKRYIERDRQRVARS